MKGAWVPLCMGVCLLGLASLARPDAPKADSKAKPVEEVLKQTFKRPAVSGTLDQAVGDLAKLTGVRIVVDWPGLLETGVKPDAKLALGPAQASLEQLLEQALSSVAAKGKPLSWFLIDQTVCVTTQARVLGRGRLLGSPVVSAAAPPAPAAPAGGGAIREFSFEKAPLGDVISFFRQVTQVNFHVNYGALELVGVNKDTPITLKASNVSVARALDLVVDQLSAGRGKYDSVYWLVQDGVVHLTTGTALDATLMTRAYDVADLLMLVPNTEGPRLDLNVAARGVDTTGQTTGSESIFRTDDTTRDDTRTNSNESRRAAEESLINVVKDSIGEDMWQPQGKGAVRIMRNMMIVSQTRLGFLLLEKSAGLR